MAKTDIIIHDKKDNVGVIVIEKVTKGQDCGCWIMEDDSSSKVKSEAEIPLGHKIALQDLKEGTKKLLNMFLIFQKIICDRTEFSLDYICKRLK